MNSSKAVVEAYLKGLWFAAMSSSGRFATHAVERPRPPTSAEHGTRARLHPHRFRCGAELGRVVSEVGAAFAAETPPARDVLAERCTMKGRTGSRRSAPPASRWRRRCWRRRRARSLPLVSNLDASSRHGSTETGPDCSTSGALRSAPRSPGALSRRRLRARGGPQRSAGTTPRGRSVPPLRASPARTRSSLP